LAERLCVPVFQAFMEQAVKKYGGTAFKVPPGGHFVNIDRFTGANVWMMRLATCAGRIFPRRQDPFRAGYAGRWRLCDGPEPAAAAFAEANMAGMRAARRSPPRTGERKVIPKKADFGTVSSGGLY
jgi:penicillin-binding protein 1A